MYPGNQNQPPQNDNPNQHPMYPPNSNPQPYPPSNPPQPGYVPAAYGTPMRNIDQPPGVTPPMGQPVYAPNEGMNQPFIQAQGEMNPEVRAILSDYINLKIIRAGRFIMWIAIFQLVWVLLFMIISIYILLAAIVLVPLILCGLYGARTVNRCLVIPFLVFEFLYMAGMIVTIVFDPSILTIVLGVLLVLCLFMIIYMIIQFYKLVGMKTPEERYALRGYINFSC